MSKEKYIGGAFAKDDSIRFRTKIPGDFFQTELNTIGFETGADAIAWVLLMELKAHDLTVYFPKHYCEETLERIWLKVPGLKKNTHRYASIQEIQASPAIIIWNHFNGYTPVPQELLNKNHILLEDCVQSLEAVHQQVGKASFTSLRKWLELDLAIVIGPYEHHNSFTEPSEYYRTKKEAEQLKHKWKLDNSIEEEEFLDKFADAEHALQTSEISFHSTEELEHYDWAKMLEKRRKNAEVLLNYLHHTGITVIQTSELFVMIELENRDEIRKHLAINGIFAPVHWLDSADKRLAKTLLSLPIDHRYDSEDMQRIVSALENGLKASDL